MVYVVCIIGWILCFILAVMFDKDKDYRETDEILLMFMFSPIALIMVLFENILD